MACSWPTGQPVGSGTSSSQVAQRAAPTGHDQHVPIRVSWLGQNSYRATVTPSPYSDVSWASDSGMTGKDLIERLIAFGLHQQDIVDAFAEADPDFVAKMNRGDFDQERPFGHSNAEAFAIHQVSSRGASSRL